MTATLDFAFHDCVRPAYGAPHRLPASCYRLPLSTTARVAFFGQPVFLGIPALGEGGGERWRPFTLFRVAAASLLLRPGSRDRGTRYMRGLHQLVGCNQDVYRPCTPRLRCTAPKAHRRSRPSARREAPCMLFLDRAQTFSLWTAQVLEHISVWLNRGGFPTVCQRASVAALIRF
jgi:hypothetical protein